MFTTRPELLGTFGMTASTHWLATAAGMSVLERGGNAFDAACAMGFVLHVAEPHNNGPAGDVPILFRRGRGDEVRVLCGQGPAPAGATIAVFPAHVRLGELHLGFLAQGGRKLREAWPHAGDLRRTAVVEWPEPYVYELDTSRQAWIRLWDSPQGGRIRVQGNLVRLAEMDLIRARPLDPSELVAEIVAGRLARQRPVAPEDALFFRQLFRRLALQRLGLGKESGAAVTGLRPGQEAAVRIPPPAEPYSRLYWDRRFPALVSALRTRMGEGLLRRAIEISLVE